MKNLVRHIVYDLICKDRGLSSMGELSFPMVVVGVPCSKSQSLPTFEEWLLLKARIFLCCSRMKVRRSQKHDDGRDRECEVVSWANTINFKNNRFSSVVVLRVYRTSFLPLVGFWSMDVIAKGWLARTDWFLLYPLSWPGNLTTSDPCLNRRSFTSTCFLLLSLTFPNFLWIATITTSTANY